MKSQTNATSSIFSFISQHTHELIPTTPQSATTSTRPTFTLFFFFCYPLPPHIFDVCCWELPRKQAKREAKTSSNECPMHLNLMERKLKMLKKVREIDPWQDGIKRTKANHFWKGECEGQNPVGMMGCEKEGGRK